MHYIWCLRLFFLYRLAQFWIVITLWKDDLRQNRKYNNTILVTVYVYMSWFWRVFLIAIAWKTLIYYSALTIMLSFFLAWTVNAISKNTNKQNMKFKTSFLSFLLACFVNSVFNSSLHTQTHHTVHMLNYIC